MLQEIVDWMVFTILHLDPTSRLSTSLNYFIYDSIKIIVLLFLMITVMGFIRTYISQEKVKRWLSGKHKLTGNITAVLFGAITPFCSCSSIPIFLSFIEAGVPLGTSFSFLIASPLINEYLVVLMLGFFGWKITAVYVLSGLIIGVVAGLIISKLNPEKYLVKDLFSKKKAMKKAIVHDGFKKRILFGLNEAAQITKKIWLWIVIGVGLAAGIHNYVPEEWIHSIISKGGFLTVPIATILGVPMYGSCAAIVPIAVVLFEKGIPLGTALAFMMATAALSLPEAVILRRAMRLKLIGIFFGIVAISIIIIGYLINLLQPIIA